MQMVLSHAFFERRFHGDPNILGQAVNGIAIAGDFYHDTDLASMYVGCDIAGFLHFRPQAEHLRNSLSQPLAHSDCADTTTREPAEKEDHEKQRKGDYKRVVESIGLRKPIFCLS